MSLLTRPLDIVPAMEAILGSLLHDIVTWTWVCRARATVWVQSVALARKNFAYQVLPAALRGDCLDSCENVCCDIA
jgi:hypothetical protein